MKNKKVALYTLALAAAGVISSADAQTTLYLTGSTAFRANVYTALRTAIGSGGGVFDAAGVNGAAANPTVLSANDANNASQIVFDGWAQGTEYIINCTWNGSEAGIGSVAGSAGINDVNVPAGYNGGTNPGGVQKLPGVPTFFLAAPGYTANEATSRQADLAFSDTSQTVSLTTTPALTPMGSGSGIVGIVPFVWAKCKNSAPDASWTDLVNVTHPELFYEWTVSKPAAYFTGKSADTDLVRMVGRNKGSGTFQNFKQDLLQTATPVQYQAFSQYQQSGGTGPYILTFVGNPAAYAGHVLATPGGDGFDSGGFVARNIECDGAGSTEVLIGYMGISDAKVARDGKGTAGDPGGAVWLTLDGNVENNGNIQEGAYTTWGHEHLYGQATPSGAASTFGGLLATGIGTSFGSAGSVATASDSGFAASLMHCDKGTGSDVGWPSR